MNFTARLLYRGKAKDGSGWVLGRPQFNAISRKWVIVHRKTFTEVDPDTISQSTGKQVKGALMVFEGDTIFVSKTQKVTVVWDEQTAGFDTIPRIDYANWGWDEAITDHSERLEIIGNKWDGETKHRKLAPSKAKKSKS